MTLIAVVAFVVLVIYAVLTLVQVRRTAESLEYLATLTAENVSLTTKQVNSLDMNQVEEYATDKLGMVKLDNSQIEYVTLTNPDTVTVAESGLSLDTLFAGLARSFSAIVEYIS